MRYEIENKLISIVGIFSSNVCFSEIICLTHINIISDPNAHAICDIAFDYAIDCSENKQLYSIFSANGLDVDLIIPSEVITENVQFDFVKYLEVKERKISIVCDSDWGKTVYDSLYLPYNTPFINISMKPEDYIKLAGGLESYLKMELEFIKERDVFSPPVGRLSDINISFPVHRNFEQAKEWWNKQCRLFNFDDYIIVMSLFSNNEQINDFTDINNDNHRMIAFYNEKYRNTFNFINWNDNIIRTKYRYFDLFLMRTAYRKFFQIKEYSILDLLIGNDYKRGVEPKC